MQFVKKQFSDISKNGVREFYKKILIFVEFFYKSPLFIFALFVCLLMRLLKPIIWIRVDCLPAPNFGEFIMHVGTYYCRHQQNNSKNSSLDLFFINPKVGRRLWQRLKI